MKKTNSDFQDVTFKKKKKKNELAFNSGWLGIWIIQYGCQLVTSVNPFKM